MKASSKMRVLACIALLFLLVPFALAQANAIIWPVFSSIEVSISQTNYTVKQGETLKLTFELKNAVDDDSSIEVLDVFLLDLEKQGFTIQDYSPLWSFEHISVFDFGDEHFWIENASNQLLEISLKASNEIQPGEKKLKGYYNFMDSDGLQWGLQDNKAILPLNDEQEHFFAIVKVGEKESEEKEEIKEETQKPAEPIVEEPELEIIETPTMPSETPSTSTPLPESVQQGIEEGSAGIEESQENEIGQESVGEGWEKQTRQEQQIQQQEQEQQKQQKQQKQGASIFSALKPEVQEYDAESLEKSIIMWVLKAILGLLS